MPPKAILPPEEFPSAPIAQSEEIRCQNRQRYEMEQLTAITLLDPARRLIVGFKDLGDDEFWVRGHMPGSPLMPGVVMCEAAAQLCSFYCSRLGVLGTDEFLAFGGMDDVRFRGSVRPGARLWLVAYTERHLSRRMVFQTQGFVDGMMVFHANILGIALSLAGVGGSGNL